MNVRSILSSCLPVTQLATSRGGDEKRHEVMAWAETTQSALVTGSQALTSLNLITQIQTGKKSCFVF